MHKTQKVTVILQFHNKGDREKLTEHNSAFEANTSSKAGTSSEEKNQPLAPKMECHHHHSGNRTLIFHLPLRLVSRYFLAAPRSQTVRRWPVRWISLSLLEVRRGSSSSCHLVIVVSCLSERWRTAATYVYAQTLIFCKLCFAIGTGGNDWIVGMAARIMTR